MLRMQELLVLNKQCPHTIVCVHALLCCTFLFAATDMLSGAPGAGLEAPILQRLCLEAQSSSLR